MRAATTAILLAALAACGQPTISPDPSAKAAIPTSPSAKPTPSTAPGTSTSAASYFDEPCAVGGVAGLPPTMLLAEHAMPGSSKEDVASRVVAIEADASGADAGVWTVVPIFARDGEAVVECISAEVGVRFVVR